MMMHVAGGHVMMTGSCHSRGKDVAFRYCLARLVNVHRGALWPHAGINTSCMTQRHGVYVAWHECMRLLLFVDVRFLIVSTLSSVRLGVQHDTLCSVVTLSRDDVVQELFG